MPVTVTEPVAEGVSTANLESYPPLPAFTPSANAVLVVIVGLAGSVAPAPTLEGGSLDWVLESVESTATGDSMYTFWARTGASPVSAAIAFDCTGDPATGLLASVHEFTGADLTSANPIRQVKFNSSGGASTANPTATLDSALLTDNGYCAMAYNGRNPFAATPPTGWTEDADTGHATPDRGMTAARRSGGETGSTITFTSAASIWAICVVEVKVQLGIERSGVLYPLNSTTVDSAAGIDVRLLSDAQAGATDSDQSVRFTHTQDGQERTFDPDNALVTTETDPLTFQGEGWALRLMEDMTPEDDANCNAVLTAQDLTVNVRALLNMNGGTNLGGVTTITFRASLWRYNTSSNTGTVIDTASQSQTWDTSAVGAENNTRKNTAISMTGVPRTEFLANEVLMVQIGCEGTTLPNATVGTTNFDVTLDVDDAATNITFAANQGVKQQCVLTSSLVGEGVSTESAKSMTMSRNAVGEGLVNMTRLTTAAKAFNLIGEGLVSRALAVAEDFDLIGEGVSTMTRVVTAAKSFTVAGEGAVSRALALAMSRNAVGEGLSSYSKAVIAAKTFSLIGEGLVSRVLAVVEDFDVAGDGVITMTRATTTAKTFTVAGEGVVDRVLALAMTRNPVGEGLVDSAKAVIAAKTFDLIGEGLVTESRAVQAQRTFSLAGEGAVTRQLSIAEDFDLVGVGSITYARVVIAAKSFSLTGEGVVFRDGLIAIMAERNVVGEGIITELHPVQAFRTFNLVGEGLILTTGANASTITIPIDEVPTEGGGGTTIIVKKSLNIFDD